MARLKIGTLVRLSKLAKDPDYAHYYSIPEDAEGRGELFIVMGYRGSKAEGNVTGYGEYKLKCIATGQVLALLPQEVEKHQ